MFTGQISSHALHDVHAHSSSDVTRSKTESAPMVMSRSVPTGGDTDGSPVAAITSPTFSTISRGRAACRWSCAGHTEVQRPQTVHASVSKSCFQVKSSTVDAPKRLELRLHQVRHGLHRALWAVLVAPGTCSSAT